ncbi:28S ribosomal protein S35, mitochondrial-like [Stylophora pistillata]|uniref:28S ribosomal protein S35, mitochondrial-like n=1 Tax=Stylophora pistillata TaxID=50429 RepID=UPI000C04B120|nr:28S ribosomal protein S35, mitochondrial-like [Stylophora pistillata]
MAAVMSYRSYSFLRVTASSTSTYLHNTTVQRRYAHGVVQSASYLMQRQERKRKSDYKNRKPKINQWIYKYINGNLKLRSTFTDWPSVFTGSTSYNPAAIPIFFKMGRMKHNKHGQGLPKGAIGNIELMKIPNFFHLSPPSIERHCQALKSLCTEWPSNLDLSTVPLRVTTQNYLFAGPSLHHPGSRVVKLQVYLKDLVLDDHARKKLIELVEDRYDPETDELTIVADR